MIPFSFVLFTPDTADFSVSVGSGEDIVEAII